MTAGEIVLRRLRPGDGDCVRALLALFAEAFGPPAGPPADAAQDDRLLADPRHIALVAVTDDAVIGGLTAHVLPQLGCARDEVYLYDLAVAPAHRRRGVATRLIRALAAIAGEIGARGVFVQAHVEDEAAVALYATLGDGSSVLQFDIAAAPDA